MDKKIANWLAPLGVTSLNTMQEAALQTFNQTETLILLSPTGSGKTLAYLLPVLMTVKPDVDKVQAVVVVPSRELALQIEQVVKTMQTGVRVMSCYGGRPTMDEHRTMKQLKPQVLVATPGRLNDHLHKQHIDNRAVVACVIDEFDKCLEFGFHDEMMEVLAQLPDVRKRFFLSATDAEDLPHFAGAEGAVRLNYLNQSANEKRLELYRVLSPKRDKLETLYRLLCHVATGSTLVFCNHRESVDRVVGYLREQKVDCVAFHGGMEQDKRERALYKFANESCAILVCTDLAARGLDIAHVAHVVHYHLPQNEEGFIHRNGRTARWEATGKAYVILNEADGHPDYLSEDTSEFHFKEKLPRLPKPKYVTLYIGKGKKDKINKVDIVGFLSKKGQLNADEIGRIDVKEHYAYVAISREKCKHALKLIQNEKIKGVKTLMEIAK